MNLGIAYVEELRDEIKFLTTQLQQTKKEVKTQNQSVKMHSKVSDLAAIEINTLQEKLQRAQELLTKEKDEKDAWVNLAHNERKEKAEFRDRLSDTQRELKEVREWMEKWANHEPDCNAHIPIDSSAYCTCGLDKLLKGE